MLHDEDQEDVRIRRNAYWFKISQSPSIYITTNLVDSDLSQKHMHKENHPTQSHEQPISDHTCINPTTILRVFCVSFDSSCPYRQPHIHNVFLIHLHVGSPWPIGSAPRMPRRLDDHAAAAATIQGMVHEKARLSLLPTRLTIWV